MRKTTETHVRRMIGLALAIVFVASAAGETRVQDVARLKGQRTNQLMGYGLVVGLPGTGDGGKSAVTLRALAEMHRRFAQEVLELNELKQTANVALVAVEATIPEFGAREGQTIDVHVSALGECKSLRGGRLLMTPLQFAMFDTQDAETQHILALAGGRVVVSDPASPTTGTIVGGATLESDLVYSFIADDAITLVLNDEQASYPMAHAVARAINHEIERPGRDADAATGRNRAPTAVAVNPKTVRVQIPPYEAARPSAFIARVLQAPIFALPEPRARVTINRANRQIVATPGVSIEPTVLFVPGLGSITIGAPTDPGATRREGDPPAPVPFEELLRALSTAQVQPEAVVKTVEDLHRSGALRGQLIYKD